MISFSSLFTLKYKILAYSHKCERLGNCFLIKYDQKIAHSSNSISNKITFDLSDEPVVTKKAL